MNTVTVPYDCKENFWKNYRLFKKRYSGNSLEVVKSRNNFIRQYGVYGVMIEDNIALLTISSI